MASHATTLNHGHSLEVDADPFFQANGWRMKPRLVQWMVTGQCHLRCPHCLADASPGASDDLSLAEAASLIGQVAAMHVDELLLTGGEPLSSPILPEIVKLLGAYRIRWSLNTAIAPDARLEKAFESWPPVFVAVSLDGPQAIHDRFRGRTGAFLQAQRSLGYFARLIPGRVAAGTTVTTTNFPFLPGTFSTVLSSGASSWGLHLLVPEGRARRNPGLFLSRAQIRQLLSFAAAKRNHFPVTLADELGYCGYWEPLVREAPFFCGAGRVQCVVLPGGDVVPCTTADLSESAGNVRYQELREIWQCGFAELRRWVPPPRCARCAYARACQGGCWLQRRHGTECFKEAWHMPQTLARAGMVVCLGLAAAGATSTTSAASTPAEVVQPAAEASQDEMEHLQWAIIQWYAAETGARRAPDRGRIVEQIESALPDDPGGRFFLEFVAGQAGGNFDQIGAKIESALQTRNPSLCLVGLGWRALTEQCLDGPHPSKRSSGESAALHQALDQLGKTADAWRIQIFEQKLDPFLRRPASYRRFFLSKAGPPPEARLAQNLAAKRGWNDARIVTAFASTHAHAASMNLSLQWAKPEAATIISRGVPLPTNRQMGVFDLLIVKGRPANDPVTVTLEGVSKNFQVTLPSGAELAYGDLLRLAYEQNRDELDKLASGLLKTGWQAPVPIVLPALREMQRKLRKAAPDPSLSELWTIQWLLTDLYLF